MSREQRAATFGWVLSLAIHGALAAYIVSATAAPDLGFEFVLPTEVEFGLTEALTVSQGATPPPPAESPESAGEEGEGEGEAGDPDAGVPMPDAGPAPRDGGPPAVAEVEPEQPGEGTGDEGEGTGDEEGEGDGVAFLPAGSQLALRLDVARIRASPIADDVRALLAVLPDWQNVLGDSGIDPLEDLDRLLVASPNLDRSRMILAGRATTGPEGIRAAAVALAASAGETVEWRTEEGVPVADWYDPSPTERVIAIVGPRHFVICRPVDLPRVLAVALARADEAVEEGEEPIHPADALLSMEEGEGLSLEVEGARNFTRARRPPEVIPVRARFAMTQVEEAVAVRSAFTYEDAERSEAAREYWDRVREGYARNIITRTLGLSSILGRFTLATEEERLDGAVDLSLEEVRRLIGLGRMLFNRQAASPPGAPTPGGPAPGPSGPSGASGPSGPSAPDGPRPPPSPF